MKTTLIFPDELLIEVKHEAVRQQRKLKDLVPELVRLGLKAQRLDRGILDKDDATAWLKQWQSLGKRMTAKMKSGDSLVAGLEADRGSRG